MGQLRNADHNVTINEVTVSHRALRNSPHDALTWDLQGIRGVVIDNQNWFSNDSTVIRSVNVTFDGVSFECDAGMLDVLSDPAVRKELVEKSLAAQREKEALEASLHDWKEQAIAGVVAELGPNDERMRRLRCERCTGWVVMPEGGELPQGGCLGRAPTDEEKRRQDVAAAIQQFGRNLEAIHDRAVQALRNGETIAQVMGLAQALTAEAMKALPPPPAPLPPEQAAN